MADFNKYTNYRSDAGISGVVFGANATVLEVELNEMQEITKNSLRDIVKNIIGDGITDISKLTYEDGIVSVGDGCSITVDGILINCSGLSVIANDGDTIYLNIWEETIDHSVSLKKYGNQQSTEDIPNWAKDPRSDVETSRRRVVRYTLSTTQINDKHNLALAKISEGTLVKLVNNINVSAIKTLIDGVSSKLKTTTELVSTLNKGSTSLTFTNESITSSSTIDVYASVYGVSPKSMSISENTLTLTFNAQTTNVDVKVVIS